VTAADVVTIGAGSCDNGAAGGSKPTGAANADQQGKADKGMGGNNGTASEAGKGNGKDAKNAQNAGGADAGKANAKDMKMDQGAGAANATGSGMAGMGQDKAAGQGQGMAGMDNGKPMGQDQGKPMGQDQGMPKPMPLRKRQTGGTISVIMSPLAGANDTMIMPADMGVPKPGPGVETMQDPAKDTANDGLSSMCGM
jgi:hypothetical protein